MPIAQSSEPRLTTDNHLSSPIVRPALVFILIAAIYLSGIVNRSFWAENEAYYALGARSVLTGNWLLPVIYNESVADKPPLVFWAVALVSAALGGVSEFSARFANLVPSLLCLVFLYRFAKANLGSAMPALLAAVVLATSHEFFQVATEVNTDTFLLAFLVLSWSGMYELLEHGFTWRRWMLLWIPMSLGMLTKGPVAPVLSALVAGVFSISRYGAREGLRRAWSLRPLSGGLLCLIPFAFWCFLVWRAFGTAPLETILLKHNIQRFVKAFDHTEPWHYYFIKLPVVLLPWSLLLPLVAWQWWKRHRAGLTLEPWQVFCLCAAATVFVFFSLSSSKRQYYLLPLMPWLALYLSDSISRLWGSETPNFRKYRKLSGYSAAAALAILGVYFCVAYPLLEKRRCPYGLVNQVEQAVDREERLLIFAEEDPRLIYYLDETFSYLGETPRDLKSVDTFLNVSADADILLPRRSLKLMKEVADVPLYVEAVGLYRNNRYYILTTKPGMHTPDFTDAYIKAQGDPNKKKNALRR